MGPPPEIPAGEVGELLSALIRNRCVNDGTPDSGYEHQSVETLTEYLGEPPEMVFEPRCGRQSALYRVPGKRERAPRLMFLGHLDVVPADPEGWRRDPFGGERVDGMIWGRGAIDMLNVTASMAAAFRRYLLEDVPQPAGDLLFLAVADEEAGGTLGSAYLVEEHWDDVACEFLLTEIAHPPLTNEGRKIHPVMVGEKGPSWWKIKSKGTAGHGSQPYQADNAVIHLAEVVDRIRVNPTSELVTAEWADFANASGLGRRGLADPHLLAEALAALEIEDPALARWVHGCTHMTVSPNVFVGGSKANVIAESAELQLDIRTLPGQDRRAVISYLRRIVGDNPRLQIEEMLPFLPSTRSPAEGLLWEAIRGGLRECGERPQPVPVLVPVGTDGRYFRQKGTVAYGVGLYDDSVDFSTFLSLFHGDNERVSEKSLGLTAKLLLAIVQNFCESLRSGKG